MHVPVVSFSLGLVLNGAAEYHVVVPVRLTSLRFKQIDLSVIMVSIAMVCGLWQWCCVCAVCSDHGPYEAPLGADMR